MCLCNLHTYDKLNQFKINNPYLGCHVNAKKHGKFLFRIGRGFTSVVFGTTQLLEMKIFGKLSKENYLLEDRGHFNSSVWIIRKQVEILYISRSCLRDSA